MGRKSSPSKMRKNNVSALLKSFCNGINALTGFKIDVKDLEKAADILAKEELIIEPTLNVIATGTNKEVASVIGGSIFILRGCTRVYATAQDLLTAINVKSLVGIFEILKAQHAEIILTAKYSLASGAITGGIAVIGGLSLSYGRTENLSWTGFVLGVVFGLIISFILYNNKYYSLVEIIHGLPKIEQKKVACHVARLKNINFQRVFNLINDLTSTISGVYHQVLQHRCKIAITHSMS